MEWWKLQSWVTKSAGSAASDATSALAQANRAEQQARQQAQQVEAQRQADEATKVEAEKERQIEIAKKAVEVGAERRAQAQLESYGMLATPSEILKQVNSKFTYANNQFVAQQNNIRQKAINQLTKTTGEPGEHYGYTMEQLTALYHDLPLEKALQAEISRQWAQYYLENGNPTLAGAYSERAKQIDEKGFPALPSHDEQQTLSTLIHSEYPRLNGQEIEQLIEQINAENMNVEDIKHKQTLMEQGQIPTEKPISPMAMGIYDPTGANRANLVKFVKGFFTGLAYLGLPGEQWSAALNYKGLRYRENALKDPKYQTYFAEHPEMRQYFPDLTLEEKIFLDTGEKYGLSELGLQGAITQAYRQIPSYEHQKGILEATWPGYYLPIGAVKKAPFPKAPAGWYEVGGELYKTTPGLAKAQANFYTHSVTEIAGQKAIGVSIPQATIIASKTLPKEGLTPLIDPASYISDLMTVHPERFSSTRTFGRNVMLKLRIRKPDTLLGEYDWLDAAKWQRLGDREAAENAVRTSRPMVQLEEDLANYGDDATKLLKLENGYITADYIKPRITGKSMAWGDVFSRPQDYEWLGEDGKAALKYRNDWMKVMNEDIPQLLDYYGIKVPQETLEEGAEHVGRSVIGKEGSVDDVVKSGWASVGAKMSGERPKVFKTMDEGLTAGYHYADPQNTIKFKAMEAYNRVSSENIKKILIPLSKTPKERMMAGIRTMQISLSNAYKDRVYIQNILNRMVRGEKPTMQTIAAIGARDPEIAQAIREVTIGTKTFDKELASFSSELWAQLKTTPGKFKKTLIELRGGQKIDVTHPVKASEIDETLKFINADTKTSQRMLNQIYENAYKLKRTTIRDVASANTKLLEEAKANLKAFAPEWHKAVLQARTRAFTEGRVISQPAFNNRIFTDIFDESGKLVLTGKDVATKLNDIFRMQTVPAFWRTTSGVSRSLVMAEASLDLSWAFIQGFPALGFDIVRTMKGHPSHNWGSGVKMMMLGFLKPNAINDFRLAHAATYAEYGKLGLVTESAEFTGAATTLEASIGKIPKTGDWMSNIIRQTYGRANISFSGAGEATRVSIIENLEASWLAQGGTKLELAEFANKITGAVSLRGMGYSATTRSVASATLFAPRYLMANVMFLRDALTRNNLSAKMAREALAGMLGTSVGGYTLISLMMGQEPKLNPAPKSVGGDGADFMTVRIGNTNVGLPGFMYSFIRLVANVSAAAITDPDALIVWDFGENPELRFILGKSSPTVELIRELVLGQYFWGEPFENRPKESVEVIAEKFVTIAAQSFMIKGASTGDKWVSFGAQILGLRTNPEDIWGQRDTMREKYAQEDYGCSWNELNGPLQTNGYPRLSGYQTDIIAKHSDLQELETKAKEASSKSFKAKYPELFD